MTRVPETLFEAPTYLEGPRFRAGALYCADTLRGTVLRFQDGAAEILCRVPGVPCGLGFLPDGDLIILEMRARKLWRWSRDSLTLYADLSTRATGTIDDMIVDATGRTYVGDLGFDLFKSPKPSVASGRLLAIAPSGASEVVAEGLDFPNGIAVNDACDQLWVAESSGNSLAKFRVSSGGSLELQARFAGFAEPDGICFDGRGQLWVAQFSGDSFVRVAMDGTPTAQIATAGRRAVACAASDAPDSALYLLSADTSHEQLMRGKSQARVERVSLPE